VSRSSWPLRIIAKLVCVIYRTVAFLWCWTELCRLWQETGTCKYGDACKFAHSPSELRPILRHPKYKTEKCKNFWLFGTCSYGNRCRFIHVWAVAPCISQNVLLQQVASPCQVPPAPESANNSSPASRKAGNIRPPCIVHVEDEPHCATASATKVAVDVFSCCSDSFFGDRYPPAHCLKTFFFIRRTVLLLQRQQQSHLNL